jgi:hypothetical protein
MSTAIQIEVLLDDKGVVRGVQNVNSQFDKLGTGASAGTKKAVEGFNKMTEAQKKSHESLQLISGALGIQIPRDVEKVISKMPGLSSALSVGFNAAAILGVAASIGEIGLHLDEVKAKAEKAGRAMLSVFNSGIRRDEQELEAQRLFRPVQDQVEALHRAAEIAGKEGFGAITAQLKASNEQLDSMAKKFKEDIEDKYGFDSGTTRGLEARLSRKVQEMKAFNDITAAAESGKLSRANSDATRQILNQSALGQTQGYDAINLGLSQKLGEISIQGNRGLIGSGDVSARSNAALRDALYQRRELIHQNSEQTKREEEAAAVASLPEYARATASIEVQYRQRSRELEDQYGRSLISQQDYDRRSVSLEKERDAQIRDANLALGRDIGQQLSSIYDDITSGNIGKRIRKEFQDLFFHILGDWLATIDGMRKASAGYNGQGGLLGAMLAGVLGVGGGTVPGSTTGGTPPFISNFSDSGGDLSSVGIGIPGTTSVGGASSSGGRAGGILSGLLSAGSLQKLAPIALLGGLQLGLKGGNSALVAGGLIGALGLGALYGKNAALTTAVAPFAGLLGPLAGGLVGFGLGTSHGPLAGTLGGAGSGALVGLLAAGPIGAAIGAIVGGLTGLFSGIFGGKPSKHSQADKYLKANVLPLIAQELTSFKGFSTDYTTAINDLEQLKSQSYDAMKSQFGSDATNDEWGRYIVPAIKQAEDQINADQAERNRRGSLFFGPPQFASGGQFRIGSGGQGLAILDDGEVVMSRRAVRTFGASTLLAMNRGGGGGGVGGVQINLRSDSVDERWLNNGGAVQIARAIQRARMEGHAA